MAGRGPVITMVIAGMFTSRVTRGNHSPTQSPFQDTCEWERNRWGRPGRSTNERRRSPTSPPIRGQVPGRCARAGEGSAARGGEGRGGRERGAGRGTGTGRQSLGSRRAVRTDRVQPPARPAPGARSMAHERANEK